MAGNCSEGLGDDFFEQILAVPETGVGNYGRNNTCMDHVGGVLQLGSAPTRGGGIMPLGLNLEQTHHGFLRHQDAAPTRFVDNVVDVEANITNNNNHHHHHHLRLHDINNNTASSSPSSTPGINGINVCAPLFYYICTFYCINYNAI